MIPALLLLGGDGLGLEHPLDDVGLLDEESSGDPVERRAQATKISTSVVFHLAQRNFASTYLFLTHPAHLDPP